MIDDLIPQEPSWQQPTPLQEIVHLRLQFKAAKRLVADAVRKLHHELPAYYSNLAMGGLEISTKSLSKGKADGRRESQHRFMANDVMDLLHTLKREINKL